MPTITRLKDIKKEHTSHKEGQSQKYYNSLMWKKLRNSYIRKNPLCEVCLSKDIITPAEHIHHRIPFLTGLTEEQRWSLLLDVDNLMSVCRSCHNEIHRQMHS